VELPVRIAHIVAIMDRLPPGLASMPSVRKARKWYLESMSDIFDFQQYFRKAKSSDPTGVVNESLELCDSVLARHSSVVSTMAAGIMEVKTSPYKNEIYSYQRFLDQIYMSRIGTRMLQQQHVALFAPHFSKKKFEIELEGSKIGVFEEKLNLRKLIEEAIHKARSLCMRKYAECPKVELLFYTKNRKHHHGKQKPAMQTEKVANIEFPYVPSHLYHIVFELLKNSLRAVVEYHGLDVEAFPNVRVICVKGDHELTIKIEDQGGGVPLRVLDRLWNYTYTTASVPQIDHTNFDMNNAPLAGFGYGLPMSRLYARYFGGDLKVQSVEGYGMDSVVYLKLLAADARETLTQIDDDGGAEFLSREDLVLQIRGLRRSLTKAQERIDKIQDALREVHDSESSNGPH